MSQLLGVIRHEFSMSIRRTGLWIAYLIVCVFFSVSLFTPSDTGPTDVFSSNPPWQEAGETVYLFNMLMPLIGGILAADRMQRDVRLGLRELQTSTPIKRPTYILGKYFGVLLSELTPMFLWVVALGVLATVTGQTSPAIIGGILVAFVAIAVPSFAFVVAFSLACPLIMPVRVYQILFTGYWFWGNFLNAKVFPSVSDTLLNASGIYASQGFFRGTISRTEETLYTPTEAWANILVLSLCAAIVLFTLDRYFDWQAKRA
jgi:ABC-type transport system involved in multi-copper enzyme maturation permease subunit